MPRIKLLTALMAVMLVVAGCSGPGGSGTPTETGMSDAPGDTTSDGLGSDTTDEEAETTTDDTGEDTTENGTDTTSSENATENGTA